jgi:hypothetical protein
MDKSSLTTGEGESIEKWDDPQEPKSPSKIDIWSRRFYQDEFGFACELLLPINFYSKTHSGRTNIELR